MPVYQRYFRVTSGPLMDRARDIEQASREARKAVIAFCKEIGAENAFFGGEGSICGFKFASTPDQAVWKQPNDFGTYMPRKNTIGGKAMIEKIKELPPIHRLNNALKAVGLYPGFPVLIDGRSGHCAQLTGSVELGVLFIGVPWRDVPEEEMQRYKVKHEAGSWTSAEMEHLQWQPTADMVEIKRWEVEKECEELNARLNAMQSERGTS
nr:hypothetical protein [Dechloromonas sp.]